jgi:hypothetical protein
MVRLVLAVQLASCELPYVPLDEPVPSDAGTDADAHVDAPAVIAAPLPIARPSFEVSGLHGAPLRAIAVSEDGAVAVSSDQHGSLRMWPSLDGKREPIVVAARAAIALAIVHDADGAAPHSRSSKRTERCAGAGSTSRRCAGARRRHRWRSTARTSSSRPGIARSPPSPRMARTYA